MNDPLDIVERLAVRARMEAPQPVSVAEDVVRRLRNPERSPLAWLTACAVAAALLMMVFGGMPQLDPDALDDVFQTAAIIELDGGF
jgi:hypothetical protein